jgi:hypothetical protein
MAIRAKPGDGCQPVGAPAFSAQDNRLTNPALVSLLPSFRTNARVVFFADAARLSGAEPRTGSTNWYAHRPPRWPRRARLMQSTSRRSGVSAKAPVPFPRRKIPSFGKFSWRLAGHEGGRCGACEGAEHVICYHVRIWLEVPYLLVYLRIIRWGITSGYHQGNETMANSAQTFTPDLFGQVADPLPTRRARTTNDPLSRNSQATARGRRIADVFRAYMQRMTDRSCFAQTDALAAAELKVDAEEVRARRAAGNAGIDEVVKVERLVRHAERKLGLDRPQNGAAKPKKKFADQLRENAAARAAGSTSS